MVGGPLAVLCRHTGCSLCTRACECVGQDVLQVFGCVSCCLCLIACLDAPLPFLLPIYVCPPAGARSPLLSGAPTRVPCWPPPPPTTSWRCGTWRWSGTQVRLLLLQLPPPPPPLLCVLHVTVAAVLCVFVFCNGGMHSPAGWLTRRLPCSAAPAAAPAEEEAALAPETNALAPDNLPPQLLFVHGGQNDLKEMHWHPQVGGWLLHGWAGSVCAYSCAWHRWLRSIGP
jgi:hypothetical protein